MFDSSTTDRRASAAAFSAWLQTRTSLLQGVLDAMPQPLLIAAGDRALVAFNRSARQAIGVCLVVSGGRIGGFAGAASERFQDAFERARLGCAVAVAVMPAPPDQAPWHLQFAPLANAGWVDSGFSDAAVLIAIGTPHLDAGLTPLARLYQLTRAEAGVLRLLVAGHDTRGIAAHMGVAVTTVRSHLKALFQKTGTARQAELIKLVCAAH